jgi:hypothetical protein
VKEADYKLIIRNLRKTYGPVIAVENASLEVAEGDPAGQRRGLDRRQSLHLRAEL